jgi:anti-sigma regulatory factor (Ser/Thr protein kinase)
VIATMATAHLLGRPVAGSVIHAGMPASPRPLNADSIEFSASPTAPFWARQHTRLFLGRCGFARETIETAQMVVSELTTNAFNASKTYSEARPTYSEMMRSGVIGLSLRHFPHVLLVEVIDSSPEPPVMARPDADSEHGRGVWIVAALSREWGYFPLRNGKCVYSILDITG